MMMAHDSTPNHPELDEASVDALESALEKYLVGAKEIATVQPALRRIAAEAREKKMTAEQLLVLLKDIWFRLPQVRKTAEGESQTRMLQSIVTLCIREYYST